MMRGKDHVSAVLPSGNTAMPVVEEAVSVYTGMRKKEYLSSTEVLTPDRSFRYIQGI
jgi:hypothetical protein